MTTETPNAIAWADEMKRACAIGQGMISPSETVIRLFKGPYLDMPRDFTGMKILDVGCGDGNNTFFFCQLGLTTYGTEIHQEMCQSVREKAKSLGADVTVEIGNNLSLPFEDNFFDYLVSWNVLHYKNTEENIQAGIKEYSRVLKPGGRLVVSTTGPDHKILTGAKTVGAHTYEIGREDDSRRGTRFFYFDAPNYIHYYFDPIFDDVQVGRTHDHLFSETLDWWLVTGRKRG